MLKMVEFYEQRKANFNTPIEVVWTQVFDGQQIVEAERKQSR